MINRIVKMTFKTERVEDFKLIFAESSRRIEASEGCHSVILLQDQADPRIFFTYSIWDDESSLEQYRRSDFFVGTWSKVKKIFDDRPQAWTTQVIS